METKFQETIQRSSVKKKMCNLSWGTWLYKVWNSIMIYNCLQKCYSGANIRCKNEQINQT